MPDHRSEKLTKDNSRDGKPISGILKAGTAALSLVAGAPAFAGDARADETTAEDTVNALNGVFGRHAKERGSHAKGFCGAGTFTPSPAAGGLFSAPVFAGIAMPVTVRFSTGGGNPKASDTSRSVRGIGLRFHIPDGDALDLVMTNAPTFFAATPKQFVEFLKVRTADPATGEKNGDKIKAWNEVNPNVMAHLDHVSGTPPPASYATAPYFAAHAFLFDTPGGAAVAAKWIVEPVAGRIGLTLEQEKSLPENFLKEEFSERLGNGPAQWDISLQLGEDGDSRVDPSSLWPDSRKRIPVGRVEIDRILTGEEHKKCTDTVFDPNTLPEGIDATEDPILAIRSAAYSVSLSRRQE